MAGRGGERAAEAEAEPSDVAALGHLPSTFADLALPGWMTAALAQPASSSSDSAGGRG